MKNIFILLGVIGLAPIRILGAEPPGLLFHLAFDGKLDAAFAAGKAEAQPDETDEGFTFVEGVRGQALLNAGGPIRYAATGNLSVTQGTICFWAKLVDWDPQQPETIWRTFFDASKQTGAGGADKIAFWRYPESMSKAYGSTGAYNYHSAQGSNLDSMILDIPDWKKGEWRFFAMSWNKDGLAKFYLNGNRVQQQERKKNALPVNINHLLIAGPGTALDEFKIFGRALSDEEVLKESQTGAGQGAGNAAPAPPSLPFPVGPATITASPLASAPVLDGRAGEPFWKECLEMRNMLISGDGAWPSDQTSFRVGYTPEALFVFVECASRAAKPKMLVREHDGPVYSDDSVELYLEPVAGSGKYYHFVANGLGAKYEGAAMDKNWNGEWDVAAACGEGAWCLEFAIPFATLGLQPSPGQTLGFNLCRNDFAAGGEWQTWAPLLAGGYHQPAHFGRLVLGAQPIGLDALTLKRTTEGAAILDVNARNNGQEPLKLTVVCDLKTPNGGFAPAATVVAPVGKSATATLSAPHALPRTGTVSFGTAVLSGTTVLVLSPARMIPLTAVPLASAAGDVVTLENDRVRFDFEAASGALVSVVNKTNGTELRPRRKPTPVFALEAVPFKTKSFFFNEDDVQRFDPDNTTCVECKVEKGVLRQKHRLPCGAEVEITVTLPAKSELSRWDIQVKNPVESTPSRAFVVHRVLFPQLRGLRVDDRDSKQALAVPQMCGLLVPSPAANLPKIPSYMLNTQRGMDQDVQNGRYSPSWPSMSWLDLSGTKGGVYLTDQDHDPLYDFTLETANDQPNGEMELSIKRYYPVAPGETWRPGACAVGVHPGDWHWSADRYHEWFYSSFKPRPLPKWLRDCNGWMDSGGGRCNWVWNDLPESIRRGKPYGLNYIQKWCNMTGGELGYAAFPFPNPYAGSYFEFKRAVAEIHKQGGRLGFYHNLTSGDPVVGRFVGQPCYRQKIPAGIPIPPPDPYTNGLLNSCKVQPDGTWWAGGGEACYLDGYWWCCWGPNPWMDYCFDWMKRWRKEFKLDACYLDSTGPCAAVCFNTNHGHKKPSGQMQFLLEFYKRLAEGTDPEYAICQEFVGDRLMLHGTHSLTCMHAGVFSEPALFRYTHPDYPLFCGCVNFFGGKKNLLDGAFADPTWPEFLAYVFLYGARFDHYGIQWTPETPEESMPPAFKEEQAVLLLRNRVAEDLNWRADFRDRVGLSGVPEKVQARLFVRKDKSAALLTLLDVRPQKTPFALTLDRQAHGLAPATGAELIRAGGKHESLPPPVDAGGKVTVNIPDFGKVAAVRILTAGKEAKP